MSDTVLSCPQLAMAEVLREQVEDSHMDEPEEILVLTLRTQVIDHRVKIPWLKDAGQREYLQQIYRLPDGSGVLQTWLCGYLVEESAEDAPFPIHLELLSEADLSRVIDPSATHYYIPTPHRLGEEQSAFESLCDDRNRILRHLLTSGAVSQETAPGARHSKSDGSVASTNPSLK